MKIYVASSWRNPLFPQVIKDLKAAGFNIYDFQNSNGFQWSELSPFWEHWHKEAFRRHLSDPLAEKGFKTDFDAMNDSDVCILVLPCGRSAHSEAGYMKGKGKKVFVLILEDETEPELMYKMFDHICLSTIELIDKIKSIVIPAPDQDNERPAFLRKIMD